MRKKIKNYSGRDFSKSRGKDKLNKKRRSNLMSKIRSKGTRFELDFVKALKRKTKIKFKKNVLSIKGKPDIVFERQRICVFLDSDFWHGWQYPRWEHLLKDEFWRTKIRNNRRRDARFTRYLRRRGWTVIRFWEHNLKGNRINRSVGALLRVLSS